MTAIAVRAASGHLICYPRHWQRKGKADYLNCHRPRMRTIQ